MSKEYEELREKITRSVYEANQVRRTDEEWNMLKGLPAGHFVRRSLDESYRIADKLLPLVAKMCVFVDKEATLPNPQMLPFVLDNKIPMVSQAGIALEQNLSATYSKAQQDMLDAGYKKVKEVAEL